MRDRLVATRASAGRVVLALLIIAAATGTGLAQTSSAEEALDAIGEWVGFFLSIVLVLGIFLIPGLVAFIRSHPNRWPILLINVVFGVTILGWFGALIWAASAIHRSPTGNHGGESGLNIFANDPRLVQLTDAGQSEGDTEKIGRKLLQLKRLLSDGAISAEEYELLRTPLIQRLR